MLGLQRSNRACPLDWSTRRQTLCRQNDRFPDTCMREVSTQLGHDPMRIAFSLAVIPLPRC
ncbi:hypothetical protein F6X53_29210, partial [Methylobacterium soli]